MAPSTPPGTSPLTSTATRVPSGKTSRTKQVTNRGPRIARVLNRRGGSKATTSVSLSSTWPKRRPLKIAREPRQTGPPGPARRARSIDTFHSGSRSGVHTRSKMRSAGARISTLARKLKPIGGLPRRPQRAAFGSGRRVDFRLEVGHDAVLVHLVQLVDVAPGDDRDRVVHVLVRRDDQVAHAPDKRGPRSAVIELAELLHAGCVAQVRPIEHRDRAVLEHVHPAARTPRRVPHSGLSRVVH